MKDVLTCDYCGKEKEEMSFVIGASIEKDWVMWEGTGKVSCPECWDKGKADSIKAMKKHFERYNENI